MNKMAAKDEVSQELEEKGLLDDNVSSCFVYSSTINQLRQKRKQSELEFQRKYEEFLQKTAAKDVIVSATTSTNNAAIGPGNSYVEEMADVAIVESINDSASSNQSPDIIRDQSHPQRVGSRNVELNERMRKFEEYRKAHLEDVAPIELDNSDVDDGELISGNMNESWLIEDVNRKITVKVQSTQGVILRYDMRMNDTFSQIKPWLAEKTGLNVDKISLVLDCRTLKDGDTPASIGLTIVDILYLIPLCEPSPIQLQPVGAVESECDLIKLILRTNNIREKSEFSVHKDDKMSKLLNKFAQKFGRDVTKLELQFDGEKLDLDSTAVELELEDEFQIDIIQKD